MNNISSCKRRDYILRRIAKAENYQAYYVRCVICYLMVGILMFLFLYITGAYKFFFSSFDFGLIITLSCVALFLFFFSLSISKTRDVFLFKKAIKQLRYPNWDALDFVVFTRPVRSLMILSNPVVIFLIGCLFDRKGYSVESKLLINKSKSMLTELEDVKFGNGLALKSKEELILVEGLEQNMKKNFFFCVWSNKTFRLIFILCAILILILHFLVQLFKILKV